MGDFVGYELSFFEEPKTYAGIMKDYHYRGYRGEQGRQVKFCIACDFQIIGAISATSAIWASKHRDEFFKIDKGNRREKIQTIINNGRFCLIPRWKNLGTQVLRKWRNESVRIWKERYGGDVIGFETFVEGGRTGSVYKADNWVFVGETAGTEVSKGYGTLKNNMNRAIRKHGEKKLIFCRKR